MPRSSGVSIENNFSRGLITEATAMNFPENAVRETDNCIYTKDGRVIRRYGIDYETAYTVTNFSTMSIMASAGTPSDYYSSVVLTEYNWITVGNDGAISFLVQQIGDRLVFFSITDDNNISAGRKSFSVDLDSFLVTVPGDNVGQYTAAQECSFASGFGYLFVTHPLCNPFYVSYDADTDAITTAAITIEIRDFERLDDSLDIDERPGTLTNVHKYNLYNQGWYTTVKNTTPADVVALTQWDTSRTDFPSNADYWWVYKNASDQFDPATQVNKFAIGNSPAPNGHYIYNAFDITRNTTLGVGDLTDVSSSGARPAVNAFYSGRVWYAGTDAPLYSTKIYFSRIVDGVTDFGKCYQANDPTSEDNADLLPNDGGVISIPDIAQVVRLVPVRDSLLVFCTNGIWKISGSSGIFSANDYTISKVSSVSAEAKNSIVLVEGSPVWWDTAGIYTIQFDQTSGLEQVVNISEPTIQSEITGIPHANIQYVKGAYNSIQKTIHFLYRSTDASNLTNFYQYDKLLVYSVVGNSFTIQTFSSGTPTVCGVVFPNNANNDALINIEQASIVKFITIGSIGASSATAYTISQFNSSTYRDWMTFDGVGVDYESYFITGYRVRGDLQRKFQTNWLVVVLEQETDASCFVQGVWDYSNSTSGLGRFTSTTQLYRADQSKDYSRRKLRIRGSGYSLQFKFYSESGKPFTLIGWTSFESGNNVP